MTMAGVPYTKFNDEVLYAGGGMVTLDREAIEHLKAEALKNPRQRIRLCSHASAEDRLHEMFIIHGREAYEIGRAHV